MKRPFDKLDAEFWHSVLTMVRPLLRSRGRSQEAIDTIFEDLIPRMASFTFVHCHQVVAPENVDPQVRELIDAVNAANAKMIEQIGGAFVSLLLDLELELYEARRGG